MRPDHAGPEGCAQGGSVVELQQELLRLLLGGLGGRVRWGSCSYCLCCPVACFHWRPSRSQVAPQGR